MELQGKRVAILVEENYEELEVWYPSLRLREAGAEITIVGPQARSYHSKHGFPVQAQVRADQVKVVDFDAMVIPGGSAAEAISHQPAMLALIYEAIYQGKLLAMIVTAGQTLVFDECQKNTVKAFGKREKILSDGSVYEDKPVIREGNLIKARTPVDLPAFCRMIITALSAPLPPHAANINQD